MLVVRRESPRVLFVKNPLETFGLPPRLSYHMLRLTAFIVIEEFRGTVIDIQTNDHEIELKKGK